MKLIFQEICQKQNGQGKEHSGRNQDQGRYKKVLSEND